MHDFQKIEQELSTKYPNVDFTRYLTFIKENSPSTDEIVHKHHILPKAIWPQYKSLANNKWNMAVLSPLNHAKSHMILYETIKTYQNLQSLHKLRNYFITDEDSEKRFMEMSRNCYEQLEQQRLAGKNKLYKKSDGSHISDRKLCVVDKFNNVTKISCDEYNQFKELNKCIPKNDWEIVAVLSPEGRTRVGGKNFNFREQQRITAVSKTGETKSFTRSEYQKLKLKDYRNQEWVSIITTEGLKRLGKEEKHSHIGKICVFDTTLQRKTHVTCEQYATGKLTGEYILWAKYKKTIQLSETNQQKF